MAIRRKLFIKIINSLTPFKYNRFKSWLFNKIPGCSIGKDSIIVGPIYITGCNVSIGAKTFIGRDLNCDGNGNIKICDNVDVAPHVCFLTGSHEIGDKNRRAGKGITGDIRVGNGVWIGANSTLLTKNGLLEVGDGSIVGCCSNVICNVKENSLVGGNPAKVKKALN